MESDEHIDYDANLKSFAIKMDPMFISRVGVQSAMKESVWSTSSDSNHNDIIQNTGSPFTDKETRKSDIFFCLRHFLRFGRVIGVIPYSGIFQNNLEQIKLRWISLPSISSMIIVFVMSISIAVGGYGLIRTGGNNASTWAYAVESFIYYSVGSYIFLYFLFHGQLLIDLFHKWRQLKITYTIPDKNLCRDVNVMAGFIFASAILENATLHTIFFKVGDPNFKGNRLEEYYKASHRYWRQYVPYHWTLAIMIFLSNKFCLYAWNFVDILIIVLSRALYFKFKSLIKFAEDIVKNKNKQDTDSWKLLVRDHRHLCDILQSFEEFLSPLIFVSYMLNTYYLCIQLHIGLTESDSSGFVQRVYSSWSFLHLIVRIFSVSLSAARIHEFAHAIIPWLHKCPISAECIEIQKTRHYIGTSQIGLTGLGCFVLTKPFILQIVILFNYLENNNLKNV